MNIVYIETFCQVVRLGSFSEVARMLHLSQPAVSQHVRAVEAGMNAVLLDRGGGAARLTREGEAVYPELSRILQSYRAACEEIQRLRDHPSGILRLVATFSVGDYMLPSMLVNFQRSYSEIGVQVTVMNTLQAVRSVKNGDYKLALIEGPAEGNDLVRSVFAEDELYLVVAKDHPWSSRESVEPSELLEVNWVMRERGSGTRHVAEEKLRAAGIDLEQKIIMELGSTEAVKAAVMTGIGPAFVSAMAVEQELRFGELKHVRLNGVEMRRPLSIIWSKHHPLSFCEEVFSNFVRSYFRENPSNPLPTAKFPRM